MRNFDDAQDSKRNKFEGGWYLECKLEGLEFEFGTGFSKVLITILTLKSY